VDNFFFRKKIHQLQHMLERVIGALWNHYSAAQFQQLFD
jgi:hypothetical protein